MGRCFPTFWELKAPYSASHRPICSNITSCTNPQGELQPMTGVAGHRTTNLLIYPCRLVAPPSLPSAPSLGSPLLDVWTVGCFCVRSTFLQFFDQSPLFHPAVSFCILLVLPSSQPPHLLCRRSSSLVHSGWNSSSPSCPVLSWSPALAISAYLLFR